MRNRDTDKEELVRKTAIQMLVKQGLDGFSMQKLAKKCAISPATLYIYYTNKDDLIQKIGIDEGNKMTEATMKEFSPAMSFAEGLKKQWENRAHYWIKNNESAEVFDIIKHSPYCSMVMEKVSENFRPIMKEFVLNAIEKNELKKVTLEVYWSIAFGPLYTLLRFHSEGRSLGNRPFKFSKETMYQTLELVIKALKP